MLSLAIISSAVAQEKVTVSGYVTEDGSGESLIGVFVSVPDQAIGVGTNVYGFYSITLPYADSVILKFAMFGYQPVAKRVALTANVDLNISLSPKSQELKEAKVTSARIQKSVSNDAQMSVVDIPVSQVKDIPGLMGEKDVLKTIQLMPGVQSGSEGNSGFYVRGGGPDQNLIILDDATVYNATHLFGFFSVFNGDALKSIELTKGGFPARYGGRLSSVLDLNMKEGNKEKLTGDLGIGLISSRLTLEAPIIKGKSSFLISGRRTYIDALVYPFMPEETKGGYYFYDLNAKVNYDFGQNNKIYLSGYFGRDRAWVRDAYQDDVSKYSLGWGNVTSTLRWNHLFTKKLFANTSLVVSNYKFGISSEEKYGDEKFSLDYSSGIRDLTMKTDFDYHPNPKHHIKVGATATQHRFRPSAIVFKDTELNETNEEINDIYALQTGVYIEDVIKPVKRLMVNVGVRLSSFHSDGENYIRPEPRFSGAYLIKEDLSLKASYAQMNQYIHLLSNSGIGLPTDLWLPSTSKVTPQSSQQVALGIAKDFTKKNSSVTLEGYYKKMDDVISYKEGASFLLIEDSESSNQREWEDQVTSGEGWSYGMELLIQKKYGKFSGWIGYTLSWTQLQFDDLNFGEKFYARYDRRHDISAVAIYKPSKKITISATWVYGTGNAVTLPVAEFQPVTHDLSTNGSLGGYFGYASEYGEKNSFRMAAYHRFDIGVQFNKELKKNRVRTWEVSVYNAYNRKNPYFYFIDYSRKNGTEERTLSQLSLFPILPSFSYSLKF